MKKVRASEHIAFYYTDVKTVWDAVTDSNDYSWRSDLDKIEVLDESKFIEHTTSGHITEFQIIRKRSCDEYSFNMINDNFTGSWKGYFEQVDSNRTKAVFRQRLEFKSIFMYYMSFTGLNLKKIQQTYSEDLRIKINGEDITEEK